mgnify:CR=1 FL=1
MPIQILMPALSPTMTEGTLSKWLKAEGDAVESGDVIAEIETDKATMEVEAVEEGVLGKIVVAEGSEGVPVNAVIALLLEDGEDASALDGAEAAAAPVIAAPTAAEPAAVAPAAPAPVARASTGARLFASPLARRLAQKNNLDLAAISGSGPHGRIVMRDIDATLAAGGTPAAPTAQPVAAAPTPAPIAVEGLPAHTAIPNSAMRKIVARRLTESKQQVPHFYLTVDCELDNLLALRKDLNAKAAAEGPGAYKLSVNDFIIRAAALALIKVPAANATWTDDAILQFADADISVAVAIDGGLITPIIKTANAKGLVDISREMKDLAGRARQGKLLPEEYQGGSFSISNLGMFGIREFAAIINPPQGAILAVGAGEQRAVVKDGALAVATVMSCTLSVDHRVVDGAVGAAFLAAFKPLIEDPVTMLL